MTRWLTSASLLLLTLFLTLPVLALLASWARFDAAAQDEKRRARAERKEKDRQDRAKAEAQRRAAYGRI